MKPRIRLGGDGRILAIDLGHAATCGDCGLTVRIAERDLVDNEGPPLCDCGGAARRMECAWWDAQVEDYRAAMSAELLAATLTDKQVTLRSIQECDRCRGELAHGDQARYRVQVIGNEMHRTWTCGGCDDPRQIRGQGSALLRG